MGRPCRRPTPGGPLATIFSNRWSSRAQWTGPVRLAPESGSTPTPPGSQRRSEGCSRLLTERARAWEFCGQRLLTTHFLPDQVDGVAGMSAYPLLPGDHQTPFKAKKEVSSQRAARWFGSADDGYTDCNQKKGVPWLERVGWL